MKGPSVNKQNQVASWSTGYRWLYLNVRLCTSVSKKPWDKHVLAWLYMVVWACVSAAWCWRCGVGFLCVGGPHMASVGRGSDDGRKKEGGDDTGMRKWNKWKGSEWRRRQVMLIAAKKMRDDELHLGVQRALRGRWDREITIKAWKMQRQNKSKKGREVYPILNCQHQDPSCALFPQNTCQNTHHELDVVKSIGKQVVLVLDQADGVEPLAHRLQRAAGTYERVEGQTLQ